MRNWFRYLILIMVLLCFWILRQVPDGKLHVVFCDVGQGDASLVIKDDFSILIDTGPANGGVVGCLGRHLPFWDKKIEILVITHPQSDHMGDLAAVLGRYQIGMLMTNGEEVLGEKAKEAMTLVGEEKIKTRIAKQGDEFRYTDLLFDVVWPVRLAQGGPVSSVGNGNMDALVLLLRDSGFAALFTGDVGVNEELAIMAEGVLGRVNVLKVAHHGSKFSSSQEFVEQIKPEWAVFSVGARNSYGHPTAEVLRRFETFGSRIWRTDQQGEVEFVSDGRKYWVIK